MKMEHKCEECGHKQDVEVPNIRQILKHRWFWFRFWFYRIFRDWLSHNRMSCGSLWCLRAATWRISHKDYDTRLFKAEFSCDKHLERLVPDKTAEITSLRNPKYEKDSPTKEEQTRLLAIRRHSLFHGIARAFRGDREHNTCSSKYCLRNAIWFMGYRDTEQHYAGGQVCSVHLKKYDDVFCIRALGDF